MITVTGIFFAAKILLLFELCGDARGDEEYAVGRCCGCLIEHPRSMTHASTAESELAVDPALVRLSVGIENVNDLLNDIRQALMD